MCTRQRRLVLLMALLLCATLHPGMSFAQSHRKVYVDDTGTANATGKGRCGQPNYATIQAAIDDPSASRIIVCKGIYTGQLTINRSVSLEGRSGAVIQAPAAMLASGAIVSFSGAQQSVIKGFTITGANTSDEHLGAGISVTNNAEVTIAHNRIRDIRGVSLSFTSGSAISVSEARATIRANRIERYGNVGITLSDQHTFARIDHNTVRSKGASGPSLSQTGISVREGAEAEISENIVAGNTSDFYEDSDFGIVVDLTANVLIHNNKVLHNQLGIVLGDEVGSSEIRDNEVRGNTSHGILIIKAGDNKVIDNSISRNGGDGIQMRSGDPPATDNLIASNEVEHNKGDGIHLLAGAINNRVSDNDVTDNDGIDISDANGLPFVNTYNDNACDTSDPDGICDD